MADLNLKRVGLAGLLALLATAAQAAPELQCFTDPTTAATLCIDVKSISEKQGIRTSRLFKGGPLEVDRTRFTLDTNCVTAVSHLKDLQGVSFAGGYNHQTRALTSLTEIICNPANKVKK